MTYLLEKINTYFNINSYAEFVNAVEIRKSAQLYL